MNPKVAKVEGAGDPRRQGCSCSNLPQVLDPPAKVLYGGQATLEMRCHRLSRRANNMAAFH